MWLWHMHGRPCLGSCESAKRQLGHKVHQALPGETRNSFKTIQAVRVET